MADGETLRPRSDFELFKTLEDRFPTVAALGYYGLAMRANNLTLATNYFDNAQRTLVDMTGPPSANTKTSDPSLIHGRALLNLMPVTHELTVHRRLSGQSRVAEASHQFVHDLERQARANKKILTTHQRPRSKEYAIQAGLIAVFNELAVMGLFMKAQTDVIKTDLWMPGPAFVYPDMIHLDERPPVRGRWHISLYSGRTSTDINEIHKIYVRTSKKSDHDAMEDPNTVVVWADTDLRLPGDNKFLASLDVISDLAARRPSVKRRVDMLFDALEERTFSSLKPKTDNP